MKKIIEFNGRILEIQAEERFYPVFCYDYTVQELREKKHWWNQGKVEVLSGSTLTWGEDYDFETVIKEKLEIIYGDKHRKNVEKFFRENS